ncbi:hypothetical protein T492DRAFT_236001 [Pavlovales sp. CCMP2436]|nr:hypothetical protein T492DRAFT_236001 [Pavlovales sp. CCMP2436]
MQTAPTAATMVQCAKHCATSCSNAPRWLGRSRLSSARPGGCRAMSSGRRGSRRIAPTRRRRASSSRARHHCHCTRGRGHRSGAMTPDQAPTRSRRTRRLGSRVLSCNRRVRLRNSRRPQHGSLMIARLSSLSAAARRQLRSAQTARRHAATAPFGGYQLPALVSELQLDMNAPQHRDNQLSSIERKTPLSSAAKRQLRSAQTARWHAATATFEGSQQQQQQQQEGRRRQQQQQQWQQLQQQQQQQEEEEEEEEEEEQQQ